MNGIICINKPVDFTSFDVVAKLRGILKIRRIGHAGTLDPMATGVLPVFVGKATRACDIIPINEKSYCAKFMLGLTTDTQDITGEIVSKSKVNVKKEDIEKALKFLESKTTQIPPMFSAVSVNGHRLYELARKGIEIERQEREILINKLQLNDFDESSNQGKILIECSKGTYVRTLIHDMGQNLGCGATMIELQRLSSNGFKIDESYTLEEIIEYRNKNSLDKIVIPIDKIFSVYPKVVLDKENTYLYKNGVKLNLNQIILTQVKSDVYRVYGYESEFIGLARADYENDIFRVYKNF